ncbi:MAG: hypothetical protein E7316_09350 [Clostridiales bacterium]|nr:hypothetical protein [Clostridiales bacterium]
MQQKKKQKTIAPVKKPFMRGSAVDGTTAKEAVKFFFALLLMLVANLLLGSASMWDAAWLNIAFNLALLLVIYSVFYQNGSVKGAVAVNQGEIMLQREEAGHNVDPKDRATCYHPLKGLFIGLLGTLPLLICAVVLGFMAQLQYTGLGNLPSWIASLQRQPEMGAALAIYDDAAALNTEDVLRMIVRMYIMPWVNIVDTGNRVGLLWLERLSVLVMALPAVSYGLGYTRGVGIRTRVHTDIAMGKRKRARKERKQQRARVSKGPEQLN